MDGAYTLTRDESAALTRRVTSLSVAVATILTVLKALVWFASDSVSILASLADSGLDLLAALGTFFAVRYAAAPPDAEHRYGHGKAEAFASLVQAGLVFASAALIGQEAIRHLVRPTPMAQSGWALGAMARLDLADRRADRRPDPGAAQGAVGGGDRRPRALHGRPRLQRHGPGRPSPPPRCSASTASTRWAASRSPRCCSGAQSASSVRLRTN